MSVLLTGANGFLGRAILARLLESNEFSIRAALRCKVDDLPVGVDTMQVSDLSFENNWNSALDGIDIAIHTAARVHIMNDYANDPLTEFRKVNVEGTLNLARQAAARGVKRFIFISSIKVNGENTSLNQPYTADDIPTPRDPYGISKYETEVDLRNLATESGLEVVIIRPPLVYGPGVKANFRSMMHCLNRRVPLPLGAIQNKRSLVGLYNLVDLIITCVDHPAAANETFLAGDGEDLSTTDLLRRMGRALSKPAILIPIPEKLLKAGAIFLGMGALAQRLCDSLQVDISKAQDLLGWCPPVSLEDELRSTAEHFLANLPEP